MASPRDNGRRAGCESRARGCYWVGRFDWGGAVGSFVGSVAATNTGNEVKKPISQAAAAAKETKTAVQMSSREVASRAETAAEKGAEKVNQKMTSKVAESAAEKAVRKTIKSAKEGTLSK